MSCHESSALEFAGGMLDLVLRNLSGEPFGEFGESVLEVLLRLEAELIAGVRDVREAVADVTGAVLADHMRPHVRAVHESGEILDDRPDGTYLPRYVVE